MKIRHKPNIGDILYSLNVNNAARYTEQKLTPVIVLKVGRKYFTCVPVGSEEMTYLHTQYDLITWYQKTNYSVDSCLYASEQEYEDEKDINRICKLIFKSFEHRRNNKNLTLEQLQQIEQIINKNIDEKGK